MSESVMLHPAAWWDCPECGTTNHERLIEKSMPKEIEGQLAEEDMVAIGFPEVVTCTVCRREYEVDFQETEESWNP